MVARTSAQSTKLNGSATAVPHDEAATQQLEDGVMARLRKAQEDAVHNLAEMFGIPSWKRSLVALVTYVAGVAGLVYASSAIVEFMLVGAMVAGAHLFIAIAVAAIAACLLAWYGHKAVVRVVGAILTEEADERAEAAYAAFKGFARRLNPFSSSEPKKIEA